jgi:integrase
MSADLRYNSTGIIFFTSFRYFLTISLIASSNGFTFHDLRHTAKTIMRKAGVDKNVRGVIFWHSVSGDMDIRYDHVDESGLLDAIDRTGAFLVMLCHICLYFSPLLHYAAIVQ